MYKFRIGILLVLIVVFSALLYLNFNHLLIRKGKNADVIANNVAALERREKMEVTDWEAEKQNSLEREQAFEDAMRIAETPEPTEAPIAEPTMTAAPAELPTMAPMRRIGEEPLPETAETDIPSEVIPSETEQATARPAESQALSDDAERQKILNMTDHASKAEFREWFKGTAIVGDSIIKALTQYDWVDEGIGFGAVNARVSDENEMILAAIKVKPKIMFLCFGTNDINVYGAKSDTFIRRYRAAIELIREKLPKTKIYVHGILPSISGKDCYRYRDEYNEKLRALCEETGATYIDTSFLLEANPNLYDNDGIHPKSAFYPKWLTYLADIAEISK